MMIKDVKFIELPKFADPRGNLSFVEQNNHIPFEIKRTYWIPKGLWRQMENFSTNSLALEFADTKFNADDYIRDYEQFKILKANGKI